MSYMSMTDELFKSYNLNKANEGVAPASDVSSASNPLEDKKPAWYEDIFKASAAGGYGGSGGSASIVGAGNYQSQGPTDLLKQQIGIGFIQVDPMAFLKTFG